MFITKKRLEAHLALARKEAEERFLKKKREDAFKHDIYSEMHMLEKRIAILENNAKKDTFSRKGGCTNA